MKILGTLLFFAALNAYADPVVGAKAAYDIIFNSVKTIITDSSTGIVRTAELRSISKPKILAQ